MCICIRYCYTKELVKRNRVYSPFSILHYLSFLLEKRFCSYIQYKELNVSIKYKHSTFWSQQVVSIS